MLNTIILSLAYFFYDIGEFQYTYIKLTGETTNTYKLSKRFLSDGIDKSIANKFLYILFKLGIIILFTINWYYIFDFEGIVLNKYVIIALWIMVFLLLLVIPMVTPLFSRINDTSDSNNSLNKVNKKAFLILSLIIIITDIFVSKHVDIRLILILNFVLLILIAVIVLIYSRVHMNRLIKKYQKEKMEKLNGK